MSKTGRIAPPAVWGKLPASGDYIRHRVNGDQVEILRRWLIDQNWLGAPPTASPAEHVTPPNWHHVTSDLARDTAEHYCLPWSFVLAPGSLMVAKRHWIVGVLAASSDKVGRHYPLMAWQTTDTNWLQAHIAEPRGWLFDLAQLTARHVAASTAQTDGSFIEQLDTLWESQRPGWFNWFWRNKSQPLLRNKEEEISAMQDECTLSGMRYLPWAYWPQLLWEQDQRAKGWFWQQDAQGGFLDARCLRADYGER